MLESGEITLTGDAKRCLPIPALKKPIWAVSAVRDCATDFPQTVVARTNPEAVRLARPKAFKVGVRRLAAFQRLRTAMVTNSVG